MALATCRVRKYSGCQRKTFDESPMDSSWLDDLACLHATGSFSRSAELRHLSQSAFSRRIQALEAWAGAPLFDRTTSPVQLTAAGRFVYARTKDFSKALNDIVLELDDRRARMRHTLTVAAPSSLSVGYGPKLLQETLAGTSTRSRVLGVSHSEGLYLLINGACDILLTYQLDAKPLPLFRDDYDELEIQADALVLYSPKTWTAPSSGQLGTDVAYLAYSQRSYFHQLTETLILSWGTPVNSIFETNILESIKAGVLSGRGIGFLPRSIAEFGAERNLHRIPSSPTAPVSIRAYRRRAQADTSIQPSLDLFWLEAPRIAHAFFAANGTSLGP